MSGLRPQRHSFPFFAEKLAVLYPWTRQRSRALYGGVRADAAHLPDAGRTRWIRPFRASEPESETGLWQRAPDGTEIERLEPRSAPG